ncbi:MAG: DUF882 domain-containing protein [Pseudomonadota bacterium]|jgi:uncharacterized protein YcbK (DUF882 family)|nr:DUF882 domain-containing protein [Pseudomonadota bacterium]
MLFTPRQIRSNAAADAAPECRQRRRLLTGLALTAAALHLPQAFANIGPRPERRLRFSNLHTGERLKTTYWAQGRYLHSSLEEINHLLRDFRTGEVHPIDPRLLDLLYAIRERSGNHDNPFEIISGYRSAKTNQQLRSGGGTGVAKKSLHMQGKAIDIRLPGTPLRELHRIACALKGGGVGLYTGSNFVHVDTGGVRYWGH